MRKHLKIRTCILLGTFACSLVISKSFAQIPETILPQSKTQQTGIRELQERQLLEQARIIMGGPIEPEEYRVGPGDELMITIGHEIGHLLAKSAENEQDEEAKAFAFCCAWISIIKEHNIGGLRDNLVIPTPAQNGVHDKAWEFVQQMIKHGENPIGLFYQLSSGYISNWHQNL